PLAPASPSVPTLRAPMPFRLRPHGPSAFAGRKQERDKLAQTLTAVKDSNRQAVFITGEPGIGKTRLVSEFAHDAHADGLLVLAGGWDDVLTLPYQPFVEALEHLVAHAPKELLERHIAEYGNSIARLVPSLSARGSGDSPEATEPSESERYVLFRAIE